MRDDVQARVPQVFARVTTIEETFFSFLVKRRDTTSSKAFRSSYASRASS
jgi:hypothetical protein